MIFMLFKSTQGSYIITVIVLWWTTHTRVQRSNVCHNILLGHILWLLDWSELVKQTSFIDFSFSIGTLFCAQLNYQVKSGGRTSNTFQHGVICNI